MIHWTGKGYLAMIIPIGVAISSSVLDEHLGISVSKDLKFSLDLIVSAGILYFLLAKYPDLRLKKEQAESLKDGNRAPYSGESGSEFLLRILSTRWDTKHTLLFVPLSFFPFIIGGFGLWELFSLL